MIEFSELAGMEIGDRTSAFGSGGMRSKVAAAEMASEAGIPSVICDGTEAGLAGRRHPAATRSGRDSPRSRARHRASSSGSSTPSPRGGRLLVDEGAARVLRESGSSLLPVGITDVEGEFEAGDAVEVAIAGSVLGKGIVEYSARELGQVVGLKSDAVRERLPLAADEAIHRDRFVLI